MPNRLSLLLFLSLLLPLSLFSQDLEIASFTIAPELRENAKSVVRSFDVEYDVVDDNTAEVTYRKVITILDDDHDDEAQLVAWYDKDSRLTDFKVTIFDLFGKKVNSSKAADEKDQLAHDGVSFMQDSRVKYTTAHCDGYPCTLELKYKKRMSDMAAVGGMPTFSPQRYGQSVESATMTVRFPATNVLSHDTKNLSDPTVTSEGNRQVYVWSVRDLPAKKHEDFAPASSQTLPFARFSLRDVKIDGYSGSFENWETYGAFMSQLYEGRDALPAELATLVRKTTEDATSDFEKIDRLYRLLQERTRYVSIQLGIGGWQPFSAEYVEENRFGDCKALSNYMGAMLSEIGIESYPVIIYWEDDPNYLVNEDFVTSAFNHVVLYVPGEDMYLECTSNLSPTGYLGDGKDDRNVVWVTPEGGKLARTPALKPAENGYTRTVKLTVGTDGNTDFRLNANYYGANQERLRFLAMEQGDVKEQRDWLHRQNLLPDVTGDDYRFSADTDAPRVRLGYRTELSNYVRKMGKRMFIPLNKYAGNSVVVPGEYPDRQFDVEFRTTRFYVDTVRLALPPGTEFESIGEAETIIEHPVGEYHSRIETSESGLSWIRTLRLVPATLPAAEYAEFRQFWVDVNKADNRRVVVREKRTK